MKRHEERRESDNYQRSNKRAPWNFPFREAFERLKNRSGDEEVSL